MNGMRTFHLERREDATGVSGTGRVAEGVQFSNGKCALSWCAEVSSIGVYESIEDVRTIHGHGGATRVVWCDLKDQMKRLKVEVLDAGERKDNRFTLGYAGPPPPGLAPAMLHESRQRKQGMRHQ